MGPTNLSNLLQGVRVRGRVMDDVQREKDVGLEKEGGLDSGVLVFVILYWFSFLFSNRLMDGGNWIWNAGSHCC